MSFFQRKQLTAMPDDIGIGDAAVFALHGWIGRCRITPAAEQRPVRHILKLPFRRAYPAIAIGHPAIRDMKGVDHTVADEPVMVRVAWRKLWIGSITVKRAGEFLGQLTAQRQVRRIGLEGEWSIIA